MIINIAVFEIGSIVCAAAPNSKALIIGRVVSGVGGAGVPPGAFLLISFLVPLQSRPKYIGALGSVFGLTSLFGPVLGGYLTSITWRWCFWINLPVGGVSMLLLVLLTPKCTPPVKRSPTWKGKLLELDPFGFVLVAVCLVCLLLAIQFGGRGYSWNSGVIVALFVVSSVFGAAFIVAQVWRGEKASIPPHVLRQRSVVAGSLASLGIGAVLVLFAFYLPIWFQVVQNKSPQSSGLSLIPLLLSVVFAVIASGVFTSAVGYYVPTALFGAVVTMIGAALISTWKANVGAGQWIGFQVCMLRSLNERRIADILQIITGAGLGLILQGPNIAVQTVLSKEDVSIGLSVINLANFLGSTIFVTVAQALLQSQLVKNVKPILPSVDLSSLADGGATSIRGQASRDELPAVLGAYNDSMRSIWYLALGLNAVVLVSSFGLEWKNVKKLKDGEKVDGENQSSSVETEKDQAERSSQHV
jgi:MFS family permease